MRFFEGGGSWGREENVSKHWKCHDNKIMNSKIYIVEKFCCHYAGSCFGTAGAFAEQRARPLRIENGSGHAHAQMAHPIDAQIASYRLES